MQVCYELTVEFNCNSTSTIIVLIVSITFEELIPDLCPLSYFDQKKILVLKQ